MVFLLLHNKPCNQLNREPDHKQKCACYTDGSAKANAAYTGRAEDIVWGVVYEFLPHEKWQLDGAEGLGAGYGQEDVGVTDEAGRVYLAFCYVAESNAIDASLKVYTWYKRFVVEGAQQHRLPNQYVELVRAI